MLFSFLCIISSPFLLTTPQETTSPPLEEIVQEMTNFSFDNPFLPDPVMPYSPCEFTKISEKQIEISKAHTENPHWAKGNLEEAHRYYDLHEETQLDRNLCCIATDLTGAVIHGGISQSKLADRLKQFDIRKLLNSGPYENALLSIDAQNLIYEGLHDMPHVFDIHLHNMGYDEGNFLNPKISVLKMTSCKNYFTFNAIRYAAGMSTVIGSTHEARKRLHIYCAHFPKLCGIVLPIHKAIQKEGWIDWNATGLYLKNYAGLLTAASFHNPHNDSELLSAISVHPFDAQWKEKLLAAHAKGIFLIKWMPPQSIPPDSDLIDEYYKMVKQLNMTLIAHSGPEHAMPTDESNKNWYDWGNPLRFRRPLQIGVNVILAHCGHKDPIADLDNPEQGMKFGYELFIRLAREAHEKNKTGEWPGKLYGDLAAVTTHYGPDFVKEILKVAHEEGIRLIYGSDYPFTNLIQPNKDGYELCATAGLLDAAKVQPLKEIRAWNPLLANYIFTRNLELSTPEGEKIRFLDSTFTGQFKGAELRLR